MPILKFEILSEIDLDERPKDIGSVDDIEPYQTRLVQIKLDNEIIRSEVNLVEWLVSLRKIESNGSAIGEEFAIRQNIAGETMRGKRVSYDKFRVGIWDIVNRTERFIEIGSEDIRLLSEVIKTFITRIYGFSEMQLSAVDRANGIFRDRL